MTQCDPEIWPQHSVKTKNMTSKTIPTLNSNWMSDIQSHCIWNLAVVACVQHVVLLPLYFNLKGRANRTWIFFFFSSWSVFSVDTELQSDLRVQRFWFGFSFSRRAFVFCIIVSSHWGSREALAGHAARWSILEWHKMRKSCGWSDFFCLLVILADPVNTRHL